MKVGTSVVKRQLRLPTKIQRPCPKSLDPELHFSKDVLSILDFTTTRKVSVHGMLVLPPVDTPVVFTRFGSLLMNFAARMVDLGADNKGKGRVGLDATLHSAGSTHSPR